MVIIAFDAAAIFALQDFGSQGDFIHALAAAAIGIASLGVIAVPLYAVTFLPPMVATWYLVDRMSPHRSSRVAMMGILVWGLWAVGLAAIAAVVPNGQELPTSARWLPLWASSGGVFATTIAFRREPGPPGRVLALLALTVAAAGLATGVWNLIPSR